MLLRKIPVYHFEETDFKPITNAEFLKGKFLLQLPQLKSVYDNEKTLFNIPNAFEIRVIKRSADDETNDISSIRKEGCFYYNDNNEWILEVLCHLLPIDRSVTSEFIVRLPLSAPFIEGSKIKLYFDGTWIRFIKDGEVLNENTGYDFFAEPTGDIYIDESFSELSVSSVQNVCVSYREEATDVSPSFYFPHGFNTFVGDVMTFSHNGTYHLIYLLDRRHHGSRNGQGAHYMTQITTKDLINWEEQVPIAEIDAPWKTYGTGTMLFHNGKYHMTYGLHTYRYNSKTEKAEPYYNSDKKCYEIQDFKDILDSGKLPLGASYSVSEDGINFTPSEKLFHASQNPSGYADKDGNILLYCGYGGDGVWKSKNFDLPFKKADTSFVYAGKDTVMKNTSECPAFFEWKGYKYLIVGFTGYYRTLTPYSDDFVDASCLGENIYDGLGVPMVSEFGDDRRIIAGWVKNGALGWGGVLMIRELVMEENGKLGMKWLPETVPAKTSDNLISGENYSDIALPQNKSYIIEMTVTPKNAKLLGLSFSNGKTACELQFNFKEEQVQINDADIKHHAKPIHTMLEQMKNANPEATVFSHTGINDIPQNNRNFCLPDIKGIDGSFTLRIMCHYSKKLNATVIDAEIAERRTVISVRDSFFPTELSILKENETEIQNISICLIGDDD